LSDASAESPNDADYQAAHAEFTATERGRNFLTEYARRSRHPDTLRLVSTIARIEATMRDNPPQEVASAFTRDFPDMAAAIEQIAAILATSESSAADGLFAAERIQDIALALRQRQVEVALCDGLEADIREVSDAIVGNNAAAKRAAVLLGDLARRVNDVSALAGAIARPAAELLAVESARGSEAISDGGVKASDAELLPGNYAEGAVGSSEWPNEARSISVETLSSLPLNEEFSGEDWRRDVLPSRKGAGEESSDHGIIPALQMPGYADQAAQPDAEPPSLAAQPPVSDEIRGDDDFGRFDNTAQDSGQECAQKSATNAVDTRSSDEDRLDSLLEPMPLPSPLPDTRAPAGLDEDPAELFEPPLPPAASPLFAAEREEAARASVVDAEVASQVFSADAPAPTFSASPIRDAGMQAERPATAPSPLVNISPAEPAASRATPSDPLADVLALSEEELIALFS
jgi:hypothetical protein